MRKQLTRAEDRAQPDRLPGERVGAAFFPVARDALAAAPRSQRPH